MHRYFLSPGLTQCRSLPSQSSVEGLLINLLRCRFSNIIMFTFTVVLLILLLFTYFTVVYLWKKINSFCSSLWRATTARQQERKEGWKTSVSLNETARGTEEQLWSRGRIFEAAITKEIMLLCLPNSMNAVSLADFLIRLALEHMPASV